MRLYCDPEQNDKETACEIYSVVSVGVWVCGCVHVGVWFYVSEGYSLCSPIS